MDSAAEGYREGDILAGKYRVERVLGAGGMGVVLAVKHVELLERRAIKLMHAHGLHDPEFAERFVREARALARLRGEHIARVHDVGRLENGVPFMVIEYLEGMDLAQALEARRRLSPHEAVLFVLQACEALAEAHAAGIIHRDLKPPNLFLTRAPDGSPHIKVIDFGIAKTTAIDPSQQPSASVTKSGSWMGSPLYMSPEQIQSPRDVDARVDVWALGTILHELLTGAPIWPGTELMEIFYQVTVSTPTLPSQIIPGIPPGLDAVILRCVEKDRNRRWADVAALAEALEPFASEEGKIFARRAVRILVGHQPTVSLLAEPSMNRAPSVPGMNAPALATNTPVPLGSPSPNSVSPNRASSSPLAASPVAFATNAPNTMNTMNTLNTTGGASKQIWLVSAMVGILLVFTGIAAYVVRGRVMSANETVAPAQPTIRVDVESKDGVPEKKLVTTASVPDASVVPLEQANTPIQSKPNPTSKSTASKPRASAASKAPDKPRPGIIPR
jgi:serine/threonine protein kinase